MMAMIRMETGNITDWVSFHSTCREAFGFPEFYGNNKDAFIDCLTYIDERDGMSNIVLGNGEMLKIELKSGVDFRERLPEIYQWLIDAIAEVNDWFIDEGKPKKISLVTM